MAIPFRDRSDEEPAGLVGYLRFVDESNGKGIRGALFCINVRGEPVDFSFSRVDIPASFLWRAGDARRHAVAALGKVLFTACSQEPILLLARAEETPARVFTEDLEVQVILGRVAGGPDMVHAVNEIPETLGEEVHVFWVGEQPVADSPARRLLQALQMRSLLVEPFERAAVGLEEAFRQS